MTYTMSIPMNRAPATRTASVRHQHSHSQPAAFEGLEPRRLMASFASVGIVSGPDNANRPAADTFATEGFVNGNLTSGSVYGEGDNDRRFERDLYYSSINEFNDGRYARDDDRGYWGNPAEQNGARYIADRGYPVGWYFADYGATEEMELLLQRPDFDPDQFDYQGTYRYNLVGVNSENDRGYIAAGQMTIGSSINYNKTVGTQPYTGSFISSVNSDGVLVSSRDEYMYLSDSGDTVIFADMAGADGSLQIGVATREAPPVNQQAMIGRYLIAWGVLNGDTLNFSQLLLELESDGDYKFYDLDKYDSGEFESIERGFWSVNGATVILDRDQSTDEIRLMIGEDGKLLVGAQAKSDGATEAIFALGTRIVEQPPVTAPVFTVDAVENGRPIVYTRDSDQRWYRTDLLNKGGPTITGTAKSYVDAKDDLAYVAAITGSGTTLYREDAQKNWTVRNLTTELAGSVRIASELTVMTDTAGRMHITGLSQTGDVVRYFQTGGTVASGGFAWAFENISQSALIPNGLTTPAFTGLVSFSTSWNALNIAGLDAQGDILAVWWAPGLATWTVNNLSEEYGADPLQGGLNVWLTDWNAINLGGIAANGSLMVTWWVPQNGSTWTQSNLTEITNGPLLESTSIASFVSDWGAMNIAGVERGTGKVQVYWWTPQSDQLWHVLDMTSAVPSGTPSISAPLRGIAADDNSLNVIGNSGTHTYRYYWQPTPGTWQGEDLTAVATER